jgi:hypothetical protein
VRPNAQCSVDCSQIGIDRSPRAPGRDLSAAVGTEALAERDMNSDGFANTPSSRTDTSAKVTGRRYLRVDQSANLRANSKICVWGPLFMGF